MLRFTRLSQLSKNLGDGAGGWAAHRTKQNFRLGSQALQRSRQRFMTQKENFTLQQSINQQHGHQQKQLAQQRKQWESTAYQIAMSGNGKQRRQKQNEQNVYVRPQERADELAAARHMLMLKEATRREMKRGRGKRVDTFRALKRR